MSFRKFQDAAGRRWQVKVRAKQDWLLEPLSGNPARATPVVPPLYADDPFELSEEELRRILDDAGGGGAEAAGPGRPSPFGDEYQPPAKPKLFGDDETSGSRRSPFRD